MSIYFILMVLDNAPLECHRILNAAPLGYTCSVAPCWLILLCYMLPLHCPCIRRDRRSLCVGNIVHTGHPCPAHPHLDPALPNQPTQPGAVCAGVRRQDQRRHARRAGGHPARLGREGALPRLPSRGLALVRRQRRRDGRVPVHTEPSYGLIYPSQPSQPNQTNQPSIQSRRPVARRSSDTVLSRGSKCGKGRCCYTCRGNRMGAGPGAVT